MLFVEFVNQAINDLGYGANVFAKPTPNALQTQLDELPEGKFYITRTVPILLPYGGRRGSVCGDVEHSGYGEKDGFHIYHKYGSIYLYVYPTSEAPDDDSQYYEVCEAIERYIVAYFDV